MFGYVWLCLVMFGYVWLCLVMFGYVWPLWHILWLFCLIILLHLALHYRYYIY